MTFDEIAYMIGTTHDALKDQRLGKGATGRKQLSDRRNFVLRAFTDGHTPESICAFIDRSEAMVLHALRMGAMSMSGGPYGRSLLELQLVFKHQKERGWG